MGNRAVIRTKSQRYTDLGVYVHWNGDRASIEAFLTYCKLRGFRPPEQDHYGWARLCQIIGNFFGGGLSVGIDHASRLDLDNGDNGVYVIENWRIVGREYAPEGQATPISELLPMLRVIDDRQPSDDRLGDKLDGMLKDSLRGEGRTW